MIDVTAWVLKNYRLGLWLVVGLFLACGGKEEKLQSDLKVQDPLFYDTNNELIRMMGELQLGMSEDEFRKWLRLEDPSMVIVGRDNPVVKNLVSYHQSGAIPGEFDYVLGDVTAVPEYWIAKVRVKDGFVIGKELAPQNLKKINRYRKAVKYYPSAKPVIYQKSAPAPTESTPSE